MAQISAGTRRAEFSSPPSQQPMQDRGRTFVALDGFRGIAAFAVALRHAPFAWPGGSPSGVLFESYLAVDFFFVLSGFVLAHAYEDRIRAGMSARQFLVARLRRLYPLYLFSLFFSASSAFYDLTHAKIAVATLLSNTAFALAFLPTPFSAHALFPMNLLAWSLFSELLANLLFGLIGKRLSAAILAAIVSMAALTLLLAVPFGWFGFGLEKGAMDGGWQWPSFGAGLARVVYSFFAGVRCFRIWKRKGWSGPVTPIAGVATLCLILAVCPPAEVRMASELTIVLVVFPALVLFGADSRPGKRAAAFFAWLGGISYGVYVLQAPLYSIVSGTIAAGTGLGPDSASPFWAAVCVVYVTATAAIASRVALDLSERHRRAVSPHAAAIKTAPTPSPAPR
jgi:peptidoglycan/LPS O-acetylase OafA/YrhL